MQKKRSKLRKGRLRGFVLKKFRLCWLPGTYFGIFLKKMKDINIRVLIGLLGGSVLITMCVFPLFCHRKQIPLVYILELVLNQKFLIRESRINLKFDSNHQ